MARYRRTFIRAKYSSMLWSGTALIALTALMGIVDTLIAGIILGEDAVAGVCLALPVYSLASFFAVAFSCGVPIIYAGKTGAFRKAEADRCFGVGLSLAGIVGLLMFLILLLGRKAYLDAFQVSGQVYASADEYLRWIKYAVLLLPLNELLGGMIFADGDERISLAANLAQGLVKGVLSVILCRKMGTKGLAIALLIGFAVSICISCLHFFRSGNTLKLNLAFSVPIVREITKFGLVDASMHLFIFLFSFSVNLFVRMYFGPEMLILVSVITLLREGQILFEGIGEAITPLIGVYMGEGTYPGVRKIWKMARWSEWIESLLFSGFLLVFAPWIVSLLGIGDPGTAEYAARGLRILSVTLIFSCRMYLDSSYFILVDRVFLGVFDTLNRELLPALPLAILGGLIGGVYGLFIGLSLSAPLGYLFSVLYIRRRHGVENYPLFLADRERKKMVELFEFHVSPDQITQARDRIGEFLKASSCPDSRVNRTMLLFEEFFMLIHDENPGRTVLAECAVEIGDAVRLITKDNGRILNLTDTNRDVSSLRAYILSSLLETHTPRRVHLVTLSYNRHAFEIR